MGGDACLLLVAEPAQYMPAGEPAQDIGLVLGQAGQDVVQPRPHSFQLGVKGRQDPDGNKEVSQVVDRGPRRFRTDDLRIKSAAQGVSFGGLEGPLSTTVRRTMTLGSVGFRWRSAVWLPVVLPR